MLKQRARAAQLRRHLALRHDAISSTRRWRACSSRARCRPRGGDTDVRQHVPRLRDAVRGHAAAARRRSSPSTARRMADASKTREDRVKDSARRDARARSTPPSIRSCASTRRPGARRSTSTWRTPCASPGMTRGGERADPALPLPSPGPARAHLPLPLEPGLDRVLGQSLRPAQRDQRLPRPPPAHAPDHARRRSPPRRLSPPARRGGSAPRRVRLHTTTNILVTDLAQSAPCPSRPPSSIPRPAPHQSGVGSLLYQ